MSKYEPLTHFLDGRKSEEVPMTFAEIERVLGAKLPESKQYPAWWSNNPSNNVMTKAWLAAGYRTERVDIGGEKLVFRRESPPPKTALTPGAPKAGILARVRQRLGGTVTVAPSVDLTAPTGEPWAAEQ